ncbi:GNAT family N-acetyltransferase [Halorhodospira abdelmalekii]|uniref:bifunctional acetate--CoA ligase family protein/GNAT family N-acetyltransferase n=1 Tax=Halorhodospira abdelmalekii TaxID=421629 RepID=UPI0019042913|nr:GNAT family N-acetyltransferase [Halorhodospira abdelmalekii]MBK1735142.1 GNAT family N-acetyltransferase [Halorhodospira abdelmalekii]
MTVRNLEALFQPRAVALIGDGGPLDRRILRNLLSEPFQGPVMPLMEGVRSLAAVPAYARLEELPMVPDLAIITRPVAEAPEWIRAVGEAGTRGVMVARSVPADYSPQQSAELEQALLEAARPHLVRIVGPGSSCLSVPHLGLHAATLPVTLDAGRAALVTKSSAMAGAALQWCAEHATGLSHVIHIGGAVDVDLGDSFDYLATDHRARAVIVYLERVRHTRKFMSSLRRLARMKPVIVLKPVEVGGDEIDDFVYDAAFRRAGVVRVDDLEELFSAVEILEISRPPGRDGTLGIVGNSRSLGLLAGNALRRYAAGPQTLSAESSEALTTLARDPEGSDNPLDLGGDAEAPAYDRALEILGADRRVSGILAIKSPGASDDGSAVAEVLIKHAKKLRKPLLATWGESAGALGLAQLTDTVPAFERPEEAVRAFSRLLQYRRSQTLLMQAPPSIPEEFTPDHEQARLILSAALTAGRRQLNEYQTQRLLSAYAIPCVETRRANTPEQAAAVAERLQRPVALKLMSPEVALKSQIGGVALDLEGASAVRAEAEAMLERLHALQGEQVVFDGFVVQPMSRRQGAFELTVGVRPGGPFGPVLYFGHGGTEAAAIADWAYGLPPLNMHLAREIMQQTRIYNLLRDSGLRSADLDALALTLTKLSQLVIDFGAIHALDINPLWATRDGVLAIDAGVRIRPHPGKPADYLPIRPYPQELAEALTLRDGRSCQLRPVLPEDGPQLNAMVERTPPEQVRMRFFQALKSLPQEMSARLTQIDYDREMALVVTESGGPGRAKLLGMVRISADPDLEGAEYDIMLDPAVAGLGLGKLLMERIIDYARERGIGEIYGEVLRENEPMLRINAALGFTIETSADDSSLMHVRLPLRGR